MNSKTPLNMWCLSYPKKKERNTASNVFETISGSRGRHWQDSLSVVKHRFKRFGVHTNICCSIGFSKVINTNICELGRRLLAFVLRDKAAGEELQVCRHVVNSRNASSVNLDGSDWRFGDLSVSLKPESHGLTCVGVWVSGSVGSSSGVSFSFLEAHPDTSIDGREMVSSRLAQWTENLSILWYWPAQYMHRKRRHKWRP